MRERQVLVGALDGMGDSTVMPARPTAAPRAVALLAAVVLAVVAAFTLTAGPAAADTGTLARTGVAAFDLDPAAGVGPVGDIGAGEGRETVAVSYDLSSGSRVATRAPSSVVDDAAGPTVPYSRSHYGGSATNSPAGNAARAAGEGQPCPSCGSTQVSGTRTAPWPEHDPPLVEHYYEHGGWQMTSEQARAYARSDEAINGTLCATCQRSEGGTLSAYSRAMKRLLGLE